VTGTAGAGLPGGEDATERRYNSLRSNRIEEEQFPEIALGLGSLKTWIGRQCSVGKSRLGKVSVVRYHQLIDSSDLLADVLAQLHGAVALRGRAECRLRSFFMFHLSFRFL
jgi:hypothetical protein